VTNVFLGIIAGAVLVMAVIQIVAIVFAMSAARRIGEVADRLERDLRPAINNLNAITADAARASSLAAIQLERADRLFEALGRRGEQVLASIPGVLGSAGKGFAVFGGLKAIFAAIQELRRASRRGAARADEEDPLFIG
jgi:hypothetical protein